MRLTNRRHQSTSMQLSMTSMIDVVFLLLIFFMTTSSFVQTERNLDPAVKTRESSASAASEDLEPAIVDVVESAGRFVYQLGPRELTDMAELTRVLRGFDNKSEGAFVRVSAAAPFGMAAAAIQACKDAGFMKVSYVPLDE